MFLAKLANNRITLGLALCVGFLVAIAAHGRLRYAEGHRNGTVEAAAVAQRDALVARAASDSVWSVLYAASIRSRDAQRVAEKAAARASARTAAAEARLTDALAAYHADTAAQTPQCDALASSCANAAALWGYERDTLTALIAAQDTTIVRQTEMQLTEPVRLAAAMRAALAEQRRTFKGPSRVRWLSVGAVMGFAAAVIR